MSALPAKLQALGQKAAALAPSLENYGKRYISVGNLLADSRRRVRAAVTAGAFGTAATAVGVYLAPVSLGLSLSLPVLVGLGSMAGTAWLLPSSPEEKARRDAEVAKARAEEEAAAGEVAAASVERLLDTYDKAHQRGLHGVCTAVEAELEAMVNGGALLDGGTRRLLLPHRTAVPQPALPPGAPPDNLQLTPGTAAG